MHPLTPPLAIGSSSALPPWYSLAGDTSSESDVDKAVELGQCDYVGRFGAWLAVVGAEIDANIVSLDVDDVTVGEIEVTLRTLSDILDNIKHKLALTSATSASGKAQATYMSLTAGFGCMIAIGPEVGTARASALIDHMPQTTLGELAKTLVENALDEYFTKYCDADDAIIQLTSEGAEVMFYRTAQEMTLLSGFGLNTGVMQ